MNTWGRRLFLERSEIKDLQIRSTPSTGLLDWRSHVARQRLRVSSATRRPIRTVTWISLLLQSAAPLPTSHIRVSVGGQFIRAWSVRGRTDPT